MKIRSNKTVTWMALVGASAIAVVTGGLGFAESRPGPARVGAESSNPPDPQDAPIPRPGMKLEQGRYAIVITDPQNDFLSPKGVAWEAVGSSVTENKTIEHLTALLRAAKETNTPVFISPHYYYPHDHTWKFEGAFEKLMHDIHFVDRAAPLSLEGFQGSGADWLEQLKPLIAGGNVIVCSPHKMYGPQTNDLVLQLHKQGITQVMLAGMSANLCTESHLRHLLEDGFKGVVVADATAAAKFPGYDGYQAALVNFRMLASDVWNTEQAVREIRAAR